MSGAPEIGTFCGESQFGSRKADIVIRLYDNRVMPTEAKVSNSSTNSVKRLNNDVAVKARQWREEFGNLGVIPAAVLGGVFQLHNLRSAQNQDGLTLFWGHDLRPMIDWIEPLRAKSSECDRLGCLVSMPRAASVRWKHSARDYSVR